MSVVIEVRSEPIAGRTVSVRRRGESTLSAVAVGCDWCPAEIMTARHTARQAREQARLAGWWRRHGLEAVTTPEHGYWLSGFPHVDLCPRCKLRWLQLVRQRRALSQEADLA